MSIRAMPRTLAQHEEHPEQPQGELEEEAEPTEELEDAHRGQWPEAPLEGAQRPRPRANDRGERREARHEAESHRFTLGFVSSATKMPGLYTFLNA